MSKFLLGLVLSAALVSHQALAAGGDELEHMLYTASGIAHPNIGIDGGIGGNPAGLTYNSNTKLDINGGISSISAGINLGNRSTGALFGATYQFSGASPLSAFAGLGAGGKTVAFGVGTTIGLSPFAISLLNAGILINRDGKFKVGAGFFTPGTNFATGTLTGGIEIGGGNFAFDADVLYAMSTRRVTLAPSFMFGSQKFKATAGLYIAPAGPSVVLPGTFGAVYQVANNTYFAIQMVGLIIPTVNIFAHI